MDSLEGRLVGALAEGCPCRSAARTNHARGVLVAGNFVATAEAATLTTAAHMQGSTVPLLVRFSNFTGDPRIADNDPRANPRGIALRFSPADGPSADLVGHAVNGFPAATPEEFLGFLEAANMATTQPDALERYLGDHAIARRFLQMIPETPQSYVSEQYFTLHSFAYRAADGRRTVGRARIVPTGISSRLSAHEATNQSTDFLQRGLRRLIEEAPVSMRLIVQGKRPANPS